MESRRLINDEQCLVEMAYHRLNQTIVFTEKSLVFSIIVYLRNYCVVGSFIDRKCGFIFAY